MERIREDAHIQSLLNGVCDPTQRTINNYVALLKSIGAKYVPKPQLRDIRQHIKRSSFRNGCTTYSIAFVTHAGVCEMLILNMDPTTVIFGFEDTSFCAAVVPVGSPTMSCLVEKKPHSLYKNWLR